MQKYPSGSRGSPAKGVVWDNRSAGSNPAFCAKLPRLFLRIFPLKQAVFLFFFLFPGIFSKDTRLKLRGMLFLKDKTLKIGRFSLFLRVHTFAFEWVLLPNYVTKFILIFLQ